MIDILPLISGLSQALRGLALFAGVILILDTLKIHAGLLEDPPHSSKGNSMAWGLVALSSIIGGWSVLELGTNVFSVFKTPPQIVATMLMWGFLAAGLVYRAALRTSRPIYIYVSSGLFLVTATTLFLGRA